MDPRSLQRRVRRWIALQIFSLAATRPAAAALGHIPRSCLFSYLLQLLYPAARHSNARTRQRMNAVRHSLWTLNGILRACLQGGCGKGPDGGRIVRRSFCAEPTTAGRGSCKSFGASRYVDSGLLHSVAVFLPFRRKAGMLFVSYRRGGIRGPRP
jgi:hypothetical protein